MHTASKYIFLCCKGVQSLPICPSKSILPMKMGMEQWSNINDRGKLKYWEENVSQCHFVEHKSQHGLTTIEPGRSL